MWWLFIVWAINLYVEPDTFYIGDIVTCSLCVDEDVDSTIEEWGEWEVVARRDFPGGMLWRIRTFNPRACSIPPLGVIVGHDTVYTSSVPVFAKSALDSSVLGLKPMRAPAYLPHSPLFVWGRVALVVLFVLVLFLVLWVLGKRRQYVEIVSSASSYELSPLDLSLIHI